MSATGKLVGVLVPRSEDGKIVAGTLAVAGAATFPAIVPAAVAVAGTAVALDAAAGTAKGLWWLVKKAAGGVRKASEERRHRVEREAFERQERERREAEARATPTTQQMVDSAQAEFAYWVSIWTAMPLEPEDLRARINQERDRLDAKLQQIRAQAAPPAVP